MKKLLPIVLVLGVTGVGYALVAGKFRSEYRLAQAAPTETSVWLEARDIRGALEAFRKSASYAEYERSQTKAKVDEAMKAMAAMNEQPPFKDLASIGLPLSEESLLLGLGQNVGVGLIAAGRDGKPSIFAAAKLDLVGMAKAVAVESDWTKVWDKLETALAGQGAPVETHQGVDIAAKKVGPTELFTALVGDVIATSPDKETIKTLIDVSKGTHASLGKRSDFERELAGLPAKPQAYAWLDVALVRDQAKVVSTVKAVGERLGAPPEAVKAFDGAELAVLQADLSPSAVGLALGLYFPEGQPKLARVQASRGREQLFADAKEHDLRSLVSAETALYAEGRGLWALATEVPQSETWAAVTRTEAGQWLQAKLQKPAELADLMQVPHTTGGLQLDRDPAFELGVGLALLRLTLTEALDHDVAIAVETREGAKTMEETIQGVGFLRARPALRLVTDILSGVVAKQAKAPRGGAEEGMPANQASVEEHAGRKIFGLVQPGQPGVYWTQVGAELAVSSRTEQLKRLIDAEGAKAAQPASMASSIGKLPEGYRAFLWVDMKRYMDLSMKLSPMPEEQKKGMASFSAGQGPLAMAGYVSADCSTWTIRTWQGLGAEAPEAVKKLYANLEGEPASWARLPDGTFATVVGRVNAKGWWAYAMETAKSLGAEKQTAEMLDGLGKQLLGGKSFEKDLVAHIGVEAAAGLVTQDKLPAPGAPAAAQEQLVAVPAAVALLKLDDEAAFKATFVELVNALLSQANASRGGGTELAVEQLRQLSSAQTLFREGDRDQDGVLDYGTLEELTQQGLMYDEVAATHVIEVRPSQTNPEFQWCARAWATDTGPNGPMLFTNQSGMVWECDGPVELTDGCEQPEGAAPYGSKPKKLVAPDLKDPAQLALEPKKIGGVDALSFRFPKREREQSSAMLGDGFTPCFAIHGGWLTFATSEAALARSLSATAEKGSLAASPTFRTGTAGAPKSLMAFAHLEWMGIAEQVGFNAPLLALTLAPPPADMAAPKAPELPPGLFEEDGQLEPEAREKLIEKFQAEQEAYSKAVGDAQGRIATWRKEHAAENAAKLKTLLGSAKVLGRVVTWSAAEADQSGASATCEWRLDPKAAPAAAP